MTLADTIIQCSIVVSGLVSTYLLSRKTYTKRRWGYVIRIFRQIPWILLFYLGEQWIMSMAAIGYIVMWSIGTKNNWNGEQT